MIQNVHVSVDRIFASPQYLKTKNYNESLWHVYRMINNSYTDFHWVMTVKNFTAKEATTSDTFYYNCVNCFTTVDRKRGYEFFIAGIPIDATPNTAYISTRAYFDEMNRYDNARDIANKVFNGFCLSGVVAVSMF